MHHWMSGLIIAPVGLFLGITFLYTVGVALFIDELTYLILGGKNYKDYFSKESLLGTFVFVVLVFLLREYVVIPLELFI